jgi:hypothetical protein
MNKKMLFQYILKLHLVMLDCLIHDGKLLNTFIAELVIPFWIDEILNYGLCKNLFLASIYTMH